MPRYLSLLLSLGLHGLLLLSLYIALRERRELAPPPAVFVELPPASGDGASSGASNRAGGTRRKAAPKVAAQPFQWKTQPHAWEQGGSGAPVAGEALAGPRGRGARVEGFANGMGLAEEAKFFSLAEKVWQRVNSFVGYPPDFIEENIEGTVLLHIVVDKHGRFTGQFLEIEDDSELLRTYAMAAVALALREPIPGLRDLGVEEIPLALRFRFELLLPDEFARRDLTPHMKNTLQFERVGHTEPKATKVARRFLQNYMPPVVAFPGFIYVDFVGVYNMFRKKQDKDPSWKRGFRMEMDQELWRQVIKQGAKT